MKPYYESGGITLYCGEAEQVLLQDLGQIDAVVTDPPYNVGKDYGPGADKDKRENYHPWLKDVFGRCLTHLPDQGQLAFFWGSLRVMEIADVLPAALKVHHVASWFKREFAGDRYCQNRPALCWEPIIWAIRRSSEATYHGPKGGHAGRDCISAVHSRHDGVGWHPCPKPMQAVKTVVQWITPAMGTVLDPFAGSGTTLLAAKELGMKAVGIEKEKQFCEGIVRRLSQGVLWCGV